MKRAWLLLVAVLSALASNPPGIRYSAYFGGVIKSYSLAVDAAGDAYITGAPNIPSLPCTLPTLGPGDANHPDGFVSKIGPNGQVLWTVCLTVPAGNIGLDSSGAIYVAGGTTVSKLSPAADKIIYSTSIPSASISSMAVDKAGNVYLAGSAGTDLQATPGAYWTTYTGSFVAKLDSDGAIHYITFVRIAINGIAADSTGNAWYVGWTNSSLIAGTVGFLQRLDSDGAQISEFLEIGGYYAWHAPISGDAWSVAIDANDFVYVGSEQDLEVTNGGVVFKLDPTGKLVYTAYVGGSDQGFPYALAVDGTGQVYFSTSPTGSWAAINCSGPVPPAALTAVSTNGKAETSAWLPASFSASSIGVDGIGNIYMLGSGVSGILTLVAVQPGLASGPQLGCVVSAADNSPAATLTPGETITIHGQGFTPGPGLNVTFDGVQGQILNASATQINAVVPAGVADDLKTLLLGTLMSIDSGGYTIGPLNFPIKRAAPTGSNAGPQFSSLVSAADLSPAEYVVAGEVVTLYGQGFTPGPGFGVTFNGAPAPILYADANQINAVVPFEVADWWFNPVSMIFPSPMDVSIYSGGYSIGPLYSHSPLLDYSGVRAHPTLFTIPGTSELMAFNEDGSANSKSNPAVTGSLVTIFMTGAGVLTPQLLDGELGPTPTPFPVPTALPVPAAGPVSVSVTWPSEPSSRRAEGPIDVVFAGQAPGQVAGITQVTFRIPNLIPSGEAYVTVSIGESGTKVSSAGSRFIVVEQAGGRGKGLQR